MAVQRKVFRIEESTRKRAADGIGASVAENAERHREFMGELQSLRTLIAPAPVDRSVMERARAQIAEAQAYKGELDLIYAAIRRTLDEIGPHAATVEIGERAERMGRELRAIVAGTEHATQAILQAAEQIGDTVAALSDALESEEHKRLAYEIRDHVVHIFEACNFQDLTGQRVANVAAALRTIEDHATRLKSIWTGVEQFKPISFEAPADDRHFLNGPKLPGDAGHSTQDDIDGMFGCA